MKAWSWKCNKCHGAHRDIVIKSSRPAGQPVCQFCGGNMRAYEFGNGFRAKPAIRLVPAIPEHNRMKAA